MNPRWHVLALTLIAQAAHAGGLHRVGPNRSFTTIQQAINAASSGDLILVDAGNFGPFVISGKSLSILNEGPRFNLIASSTGPVIRIERIRTGQCVTLMGFNTSVRYGHESPVIIDNCDGPVRIKNASIEPTTSLNAARMSAVVSITNCAAVSMHSVEVIPSTPLNGRTINGIVVAGSVDRGICAVRLTSSKVHFARCMLRGYDNLANSPNPEWGGDALRLYHWSSARIDESPTQFIGGAARTYGGSAVHLISARATEDVEHCGRLFGADRFIRGAAPNLGGFYAKNHDRGQVSSSNRRVPGCLGTSVGHATAPARFPINTTQQFTVTANHPRQYVLLVGPSAFQTIPGINNAAYVDLLSPNTLVLSFGTLSAPAFSASTSVSLPGLPALIGYQLATQAGLGVVPGTRRTNPSLSMAEIVVITQ